MNQLPWWIEIPLLLVTVYAGRAYGKRLQSRGVELTHSLRVRELPLLPLSLFGFVAAVIAHNVIMNNPQLSWQLPVIIEYYIQPVMWAMQIFFLVFTMAAVTILGFAASHRFGMTQVVFSVIVLAIVEGLLRVNTGPARVTQPPRMKDGVIWQTTDATCAAATGANIAEYFGLASSEAAMAEAMNTNRYGTTPGQIIHGLGEYGLHARKVTVDADKVDGVTPPAVVLLKNLDQIDGHAVALMGFEDGAAVVWDPLGGRKHITPGELSERWIGHAIEVRDHPF